MIQGRRVTLRPVEERDYPLIHAWQNDPEVWWLMDYEAPFSLADIAESEKRAAEEGFPFIIEAEGHPIGRIGINNLRRRDRICSLYIFIGDRTAWGKGFGNGGRRRAAGARLRGGSTSIRSSCGPSPRTSARSAPTRTPGSGRKRGSPSARGRTDDGSIAS